jgi:predicted enzyme related to lactoylglutathione lyase
MANQIVWVDIPVLDLERAISFYSAVLGTELAQMEFPSGKLGFLPGRGDAVSGCLFQSETIRPSDHGPLIYLNCEGRLDVAVAAVPSGGGTIVEDIHEIGPHGYRAIILDSEGNRIALHSHTPSGA